MSKKVKVSAPKTVSTISAVRKALFVQSKELLGNFKSACEAHLTAVGDIRAHFVALGKEGNFNFCDVIIGDTPQANKKNGTLGDPEVIAHTVGFATNIREIHAQATFALYSADQIKAKGGAEKALEKARNAAKTWYVEAIKGTKRNIGKSTGTSKPQSKGKKNGKVTDLVEVADIQALNYVNAITALIDSAPDTDSATSLREIRELIAGYHALDI
jgi:hypothetical protein